MSTVASNTQNKDRSHGGTISLCKIYGKMHWGIYRLSTRVCNKCGEMGHMIRECPMWKTRKKVVLVPNLANQRPTRNQGNQGKNQQCQGRVFTMVPSG